jgi:uncharacterized protein
MIHPNTEVRFINDKIGYGVVATEFIPKGTITWALDKLDRIITPAQFKKMDALYQQVLDKYSYRNSESNYVLCWDNAKFVNHSSNSNCITTAYEFELAIRDIYPGEELTDDYGYLNVDEPFEVIPEPGINRNVVYPDDLIRFHRAWDEKLLDAFQSFSGVKQPLMELLSSDVKEKTYRIASRKEKMDSILSCYCGLKKLNGHAKELVKEGLQEVKYPF